MQAAPFNPSSQRLHIPFEAGLAETGVVGWILPLDSEAAKRPAIGLRADIDALPIEEETGLAYASTRSGTMHACGHDGHTAILLGTALALAAMRDRLSRPVKLLFQPAEEVGGGAARMIGEGALDATVGGIAVGRMFGLHGWPHAPLGTVRTRTGALFASTDWVRIRLTGRGGHAAAPHRGTDPIVAAAQTITALQSIVSRNIDPALAAVLTITQLRAGTAVNIIPDVAELSGTIRAVCPQTRNLVAERVEWVAQQTAAAMGCEAEVQIDSGYPPTFNDEAWTTDVIKRAAQTVGEPNVMIMEHPEMVAEDFAYYGEQIPSCFALLGLCPTDRAHYPGLHTPTFDFNDAAIPLGIRLMCQVALG